MNIDGFKVTAFQNCTFISNNHQFLKISFLVQYFKKISLFECFKSIDLKDVTYFVNKVITKLINKVGDRSRS